MTIPPVILEQMYISKTKPTYENWKPAYINTEKRFSTENVMMMLDGFIYTDENGTRYRIH